MRGYLRVQGIELMNTTRWRVRTFLKTVDYRIGRNVRPYIQNRDGDRQVETTGDTKGGYTHHLMHLEVNPILCVNDVRLERGLAVLAGNARNGSAEFWFQLMLKYRAELPEINTVRLVEIEVLITEPNKQFVPADGVRPFGEDRPETFCLTRHHTQLGIEGKHESRNRRRNRQLGNLRSDLGIQG